MSPVSHLPDPGAAACGCCEAADPADSVVNRPGLPALRYRVGTHPTLLRRMLAALPTATVVSDAGEALRPLRALTTRAPDDPAIALLDAWAVVGDVLTFYQERIANEGFLRTATERRSVLELARAIGYELSPGVAASTWLAFTVEDPPVVPAAAVPPERRGFQGGPGNTAPRTAVIPAGTQVRSVPAPGESAQTFETAAALEGRAEWNALRPRLTRPQPLDAAARSVWVEGAVTDLRPGGWTLFVTDQAGERVVTPRRVVAVTPEEELGRTRIDFGPPLGAPPYLPPLRALLSFERVMLSLPSLTAGAAAAVLAGKSWRDRDLSALLGMQRWRPAPLLRHVGALRRRRAVPPAASFDLDPPEPGVVALTVRAGAFGHNAPRHGALPEDQRGSGNLYPRNWDNSPVSIAQDSRGDFYRSATSVGKTADDAHFFFERVVPEVLPGGWVLLEGPPGVRPVRVAEVRETSLADFALSGRVTGVLGENADGSDLAEASLDGYPVRATTLHAGSRPLALAPLPIDEDVGRDTAEEGELTLDGLVLGLSPGRWVAVTGERADLPGVVESEVAAIAEVLHSDGFTTLVFRGGLRHRYRRATVTLNANVAEATHGEAVSEVLGSGDGRVPHARFDLRRPPLTHVSADTPTGRRSTLEVRVNDLLWEEVPSLFGLAPDRHAYTVRIDDEARATVVFGDGRAGARPPTGRENVVARYRTGIGRGGEVEAGALTILQSRPLGVREVVNPVPAAGAADPETLNDARDRAPLTVRTMQRIVSLDDHADFARGFAGVGKAEAVSLWDGRRRLVSLTIASASGDPVEESSALFRNLAEAIAALRAPLEPFRVGSFVPLHFDVAARVRVAAAYRAEAVLAAAETALREAFGFARRGFGEGVAAAEVVAAIHRVAGVVAVDLDAFHRVTDDPATPTLAATLAARAARWDAGTVAPAELLLVNPAGIALTEMTA